jgi:hypothetical protein
MKTTRIAAALSLLAVSGSLLAQTIVTVNGSKIDSSDLERQVQTIVAESQGQVQDSPQLRQSILNDMVVETVIVQEARRLKIDKSKEVQTAEAEALKEAKAQGADKKAGFKQQWADYQSRIIALVYMNDLAKKQQVSEADIKKRYDEVNARYKGGSEVQIGLIVTEKAEQAQAAIKELAAKKSFTDVAKKYSVDPNAQTTGGLSNGYIPLLDLQNNSPEIYQAVSGLSKGGYSKTPISGDKINVVVYLHDKRPVTIPAFAEQKDNIGKILLNERIDSHIDGLLKKATIVPAK